MVRQGRSPYEHHSYPYPPTMAVFGAWITELWGSDVFLHGFRYANLLGGCGAVWSCLLLTGWPWLLRLGVGWLGIFLIPTLEAGLFYDNLSTLVSGTAIAALVLWQRVPILAGILLGFSLSFKPMALIAFFLLLAHRPTYHQRNHWITSGIAAATSAILLSIAPLWFLNSLSHPNVKATVIDWSTSLINVSLYRILVCFGVKLPPLIFLAAILLTGLIYVRRRSLNQIQLTSVACSMCLLGLPVVWRHTLLIVLPVQCMALVIALRRFRRVWKAYLENEDQKNNMLRGLLQFLLVIAGWVTVFESQSWAILGASGVLEESWLLSWPSWIHGTIMLIPVTTLILLTTYVVRCEDVEYCH